MTTNIISNGSKWAGQEPDTIETLLDVLSREALCPRFEDCGGFITLPTVKGDGFVHFFGNFDNLSHVFNISTDDPETICKLTDAITANIATPAYRAAKARLQKWRDDAAKRQAERDAERRREMISKLQTLLKTAE